METAKLLDSCNTEEKVSLKVLQNAYTINLKQANVDPSSTNLKSMTDAKKLLADEKMKLQAKYFPEKLSSSSSEPSWETFTDTNVQYAVLTFLVGTGWSVKKQTFYNHCADGKLKKNRKGFYTKTAVKKYAEAWLVHNALGETVSEYEEGLAKKKTLCEIKRIVTAEEHERFKIDVAKGKYIERSKIEMELVSRVVVLDAGFDYLIKANLSEMIAIVGGDAQKAPLLLEFLIRKKDEQMSNFANLEDFTVCLEIEE